MGWYEEEDEEAGAGAGFEVRRFAVSGCRAALLALLLIGALLAMIWLVSAVGVTQ